MSDTSPMSPTEPKMMSFYCVTHSEAPPMYQALCDTLQLQRQPEIPALKDFPSFTEHHLLLQVMGPVLRASGPEISNILHPHLSEEGRHRDYVGV